MKMEPCRWYLTAPALSLVAMLAVLTGNGPLAPVRLPVARAEQAKGTPQTIRVEAAEREAILTEMRTMMRSLGLMLQGLADGNAGLMEQAARASGAAKTLPRQLEKKLPLPYVRLDEKVHRRFDQLADTMKAGSPPPNVVTRLAAIAGYCTACHDMFRLDVPR